MKSENGSYGGTNNQEYTGSTVGGKDSGETERFSEIITPSTGNETEIQTVRIVNNYKVDTEQATTEAATTEAPKTEAPKTTAQKTEAPKTTEKSKTTAKSTTKKSTTKKSKEETTETENKSKTTGNARTGDNSPIAMSIFLLLAALFGGAITFKIKKSDK